MLHELFDEIEEKKPIDTNVARMRRGEGTFVVLRIRNNTDLDQLADILDEPRLKSMKRGETKQIKWHHSQNQRNAIGQFFEDENE